MNAFHGMHVIAAAACLLVAPATAQDYPTRPVKVLVQFPPGGIPDTSARVMAEKLNAAFGKPFIVENRPGAGGNIATDLMTKSDPDGHILLLASSATLTINPNLYKKLPFDLEKDIAPLSIIGSFDFVLLATPKFAPNTVGEIVTLAKENPGRFNIGSSGYGSEHHLAAELFNLNTGARLTHVPYKGFGPASIDLVGGQIELTFGSVPAALQLVRGGKVKAIAVTGPRRNPDLPDVPTFAEAGFPGIRMTSWVALLAPAKTPKPVLEKLSNQTAAIVQSLIETREFDKLGLGQMETGPAALAARITDDTAFWAKVIQQSKVEKLD